MKIPGFETIRLGEFPNDPMALATGAARGLGRATARLAAQRSAAVVTGLVTGP
jgi:NAD(P)-dependent dehydrogenase (short-subunit alcohol dehydrogenase family)